MKIQILFKTPDAVDRAISESISLHTEYHRKETRHYYDSELYAKAKKALEKWIKYGENVTIEIDIDTGTATVLPA